MEFNKKIKTKRVHVKLFLAILQCVLDLIIYLMPYSKLNSEQRKSVKIVAHRGWHNNESIKENTLESFELALKNNLWAIEFDVRWTLDGIPVICHDENTLRVWETDLLIADTLFCNLRKRLPAIPTLEEVVIKYGKKLHFFIELKSVNFEKAAEYKMQLKSVLSPLIPGEDFTFYALSMKPILSLNAFDFKFYILVAETNTQEVSEDVIQYKLGGLSGHFLLVNNKYLKKHHALNQKVGTGFCRTKNCLAREINRGVDFVVTNHPWNLI